MEVSEQNYWKESRHLFNSRWCCCTREADLVFQVSFEVEEMTSRFRKAAYGRVKGKPGVLNTGANVGVKIVQLVYLRPGIWGYDKARGKK